jgi:hypothetical protein
MSNTENTNAIDEKKNKETTTSTPDFKKFIQNYIFSIVFTIGISIFIIGGLGLYTTKIAQSNILPDDIELAPYTIIDRIVKEDFEIDINIMKPSLFAENKDILSQKSIFNSQEYLDSFSKNFLCYLKKISNPNLGVLANLSLYLSHVYDNLVAKNFLAINTIFLYLSYLPESAIMLLYGIFGIFIWIALYFFNVCISIFYHITNIQQLFRNTEDNKWEPNDKISFLRFIKLLLFLFIWIPFGVFSTFITPVFFTIYGLIAPLFANYKIKTKDNNTNYNVLHFLLDTFIYKKNFFFILATLSLFSNGITYLDTNSIINIIIAVIFVYIIGLYTNSIPNNEGFTLGINKITQAIISSSDKKLVQICKNIPINDIKMDKIKQEGTFRELTKIDPKTVNQMGGVKQMGSGGKKELKHASKKYNIKWA